MDHITFTKKIVKSSNGFLIWIPKDIIELIKLEHNSTVEIILQKFHSKFEPVTFTKRVVKSGRGYFSWVPKDVTNFLKISKSTIVELKIKKLGNE